MIERSELHRGWTDRNAWLTLIVTAGLWAISFAVAPGSGGAGGFQAWLPPCPLRTLTGIPCPFCGITTGCAWLARGSILKAFESNILSPFLMAGSLIAAAYVAVFRIVQRRAIVPPPAVRRTFWIAAGAATAVSWIVNLLRY